MTIMCCKFGTRFLSHEPTIQEIKDIKNSKALDKVELVDISKLIRLDTNYFLEDFKFFNSLVAYYCKYYLYFNNEVDMVLWKLKYE